MGQNNIKQALDRMGWKVKAEDRRPIVAASQHLIDQYAEVHGLKENDAAWLRDFEQVFRLEKDLEKPKDKESESDKNERRKRQKEKHRDRINEVKLQIAKNRQTTYLKSLKHLIDEGELYVKGISYGNWSKFASQTHRNAIDSRAFKAYCHILGLDWQEIAEPGDIYSIGSPQGWGARGAGGNIMAIEFLGDFLFYSLVQFTCLDIKKPRRPFFFIPRKNRAGSAG